MSNPMFSVIIPAYNSSGHIRKLLDSVKSQSFTDYELIVICDSCTDNTEEIAKEYGAITRAVSFHRDGLSRDLGIRLATGKYILFADDDDWFLHEFVFKQIADKLTTNPVDMLAFSYVWRNRGYTSPHENNLFTPRITHIWSRCWKREVIGTAAFGAATFCSDTYFLRDMKRNVKSILVWDMPMYYYNFMREGSQTDLFVHGQLRQSPVAEEER